MAVKLFRTTNSFMKKLKDDDISAYSAQAAFFMILSVFPFLMLLLICIKYTPLTEELLLSYILRLVPDAFSSFATDIIEQLYSQSNITILSVTAVTAMWSSSKGVMAIIRGMNSVHQIKEQRNYIFLRIISLFYTIIFLVAILVSLALIVFGNNIYHALEKQAPLIYGFVGIFIRQKFVISLLVLILLFICIYKIVPNKKYGILNHIPGAVFSAFSWIALSTGFSIYTTHFSNFSSMYGSISTFMLLMLWVYICMYLMFLGVEINAFFKHKVDRTRKYLSERYHKIE